MKVRVKIVETRTIERTYEVNGVNSLDMAKKCAERCMMNQYQPNTYMYREVPRRPTYKVDSCEIIEC